jgi:hypothetical protein
MSETKRREDGSLYSTLAFPSLSMSILDASHYEHRKLDRPKQSLAFFSEVAQLSSPDCPVCFSPVRVPYEWQVAQQSKPHEPMKPPFPQSFPPTSSRFGILLGIGVTFQPTGQGRLRADQTSSGISSFFSCLLQPLPRNQTIASTQVASRLEQMLEPSIRPTLPFGCYKDRVSAATRRASMPR